ncbi:TauD/TfdA dioxygenase family protein [Paenibacillus radicis (ex Xue et al. 2023)]|uniref:TauD/TfdA family dioxygenase n=1 Tax=Paenibacillus radicis (ex Xue et al. 2023) TaxID=2972489 RepID=A0ABT1YRJ9_9BACL|nr:TauD/TfdA family dioxygenase [Paenibacillus radicis (ex Xue et al. 2023)]MCR8635801.1 TauD/TfdA family dioxygenase [Paenibacillus radicis (ex Xue et al. 2023)]
MSEVLTNQERPLKLPDRGIQTGARILNRLAKGVEDKPYTLFGVNPLGPLIGAEITGIDLRNPVSPELQQELNRALLEWKVIFFRDQHITSQQQQAFAQLWGELETHPFLPQGDSDEVVRFAKNDKTEGKENSWHSDVSWRLEPALGAILRLVEVPPAGGDTLWADMGAAYDNLPDEIKERIDGLTAIHDFTHAFGVRLSPDELAAKQAEFPAAEHPIVRIHPETGRRTLYVNPNFTSRIVGLEPDEGEQLLQYLFKQAHIPEYQVRFRWENNSIAFWDNRATQHYAVSDYFPNRRVAERVAITGDRPY